MVASRNDEASAPTVLVVEDDALTAVMVEDALAEAGYRPVWSSDGHIGIAVAEALGSTVAAVVDLHLTDRTDGRHVVRRLRQLRPRLPVVVITGYARDAPQADLRGLGGPTVMLTKPFGRGALVRAVAALRSASLAAFPVARQRPAEEPCSAEPAPGWRA